VRSGAARRETIHRSNAEARCSVLGHEHHTCRRRGRPPPGLAVVTACGTRAGRRTPAPRRARLRHPPCLSPPASTPQQPADFGPPQLRGQRRELRVGAARLGPRLRAAAHDRRRGAELDGASSAPAGDPPALATSSDGYAWSTGGALWLTTTERQLAARQLGQVLSLETCVRLGLGHRRPAALPDVWRAPAAAPSGRTSASPGPQRHPARPRAGRLRGRPGGRRPIPPSVEVYTGTQAGRHLAVPCPASLPVRPPSSVPPPTAAWCSSATSRASRPPTTWRTSPLTGDRAGRPPRHRPTWSDGVTTITGKRFSWSGNVLVSSPILDGRPGRAPAGSRSSGSKPISKA